MDFILQGTNMVQQIKIADININSYLRDCICNLERIYIILLTNFMEEKNNFVQSFNLLNMAIITC